MSTASPTPAIPTGVSSTGTPTVADLLRRIVAARDLDQRPAPPPT